MVKATSVQELGGRGKMNSRGQGEGFVRPAELRDCSRGQVEVLRDDIVRRGKWVMTGNKEGRLGWATPALKRKNGDGQAVPRTQIHGHEEAKTRTTRERVTAATATATGDKQRQQTAARGVRGRCWSEAWGQ